VRWKNTGFGELDTAQTVRTLVPALLGLALGVQTILFGLFKSILAVRLTAHEEVEAVDLDPGAAPVTTDDNLAVGRA
jgi:hypothetical protein